MSFFTGCQVESNENEKATYTVTYNANGGSGEMKTQTAEEGTEITLTANAFTREGYTFSGWNTAVDGKGTDYADKSTTKLTAETTLYAKWNPNAYKVMFCDDSGNADDAIIETTYDTEFALPETTTLSKTGYNFYGWNTEPDGSGKNFKPGEKVKNLTTEAGTVTLYVCWLEKGAHTITYVLNDGINDESNPEIFLERNAVELKKPSRTFYEFAGWYDNADFSGEKLTGWNAGEKTGDITLYAKWAITADSVSEAIKNIPADGKVHTVALAGEISEDIITAIRKALIAKPEIKVNLDLSGTTGLTEIPAWAFFDEDEWTECEALAGIVLPEGIESINRYAFWKCPNLTDIVIPDSVKIIDYAAFQGSGLASIKFGSGLELIGKWAFQVCKSLAKITVPGSVKTIVHGAFGNCDNLEEVVLEEGVQTIGEDAFSVCPKLSTVTIPKSTTFIGNGAFYYAGLQTVNYGGTMAEWNALKASIGTSNDVLLNAAIYCTDGSLNTDAVSVINRLGEGEHTVTVTGEVSAEYLAEIANAIKGKYSTGTKVILDLSGATGLESIPEMTFNANFGLIEIVLPQSVTSIENGAFATCIELKSVKIGSGVTKIGDLAFVNCTSLTSIEIPDSVTSVGAQSFQACESLKDVTLGKGLTSISSCMFSGCSALEKIVIPAEVKSIESSAFGDCTKLADVYYGGTVAEWNALKNDGKIDSTGNDALFNATIYCTDGIVIISDKAAELITSLDSGEYNIAVTGAITDETISAIKNALKSNGNAKISLDLSQTTGLTSISNSAFYGCGSLTSVNIPDSVTSIGDYAFQACSNLASVTIPDSVTSIGKGAFSQCTNLTSVNIPDGVTSIANTTFCGCSSLTSVNIPNSVTSIGIAAFGECESLTSITIPNSVTSIDEDAFRSCSNLTAIAIPDSVDSIGGTPFKNCTSLTELTVSEGNQTYKSYENCIYTKTEKNLIAAATGLTSIKFLEGVASIGEAAFYSCRNLTTITIPDSVTSIGDWAFHNCTSLTSVTIPDSVASIGNAVFMESGLTSVTIPDSVTSIDKDVFYLCSLTEVTYKGTKAQWEAFGVNKGSITIHCSDGDI